MSVAAGALTIGAALAQARAALHAVGIESAALDARLLVGSALKVRAETVIAYPERSLTGAEAGHFEALLRRRVAREPMAYILGRREFWSLDFAVTPATLTPRVDTETLVAAALNTATDRRAPLRLLDLGTGTGCLLLALLSELPRATGVGVDRSAEALAVARANAAALGLGARASFVSGEWGHGLDRTFDIIVSNPPYIETGALAALPDEVRYEPALALDGGADGLAAYRALIPDAARLLAPGGFVALEIGEGQAGAVETLLESAGLPPAGRRTDLAGIERCIVARGRG